MSVFFRRFVIALAVTLFFIACSLFAALSWLSWEIEVPESERIYLVPKGQSLYGLADALYEKQLLSLPKVWAYYAYFIDKAQIKAGEYELDERESPLSLLEKFKSAKVIQYKLTFVEGTRAQDAIDLLAQQQKLTQTIPENFEVDDHDIVGIDEPHLEGWIYPDTYYYSAGDLDVSLVRRGYKKMKRVLEEEWRNRAQGLPFETPYEALIMASIVEKETGAPHERSEIAGVFVRRLELGMRLATDPTVIYGMGDRYQGNITRADLRHPTPYNTYTMKGLPPTPIALAGREAIHAVLHPKEGESLYFVAKGDGTHYFSKTLAEHNEAVAKYQLSRKENYRSSYKKESK